MKVFTTFSIAIIIVVTLNSCSSTHNSTGRNNAKTEGYYNTSLQITPAPMHYLGIIPFGTYGGVMRIPIFYYNLGDYYRDVALNALDLYNNPSSYLLAYYSWNAYYNPYYFSSIPDGQEVAFNTSINISPVNQYSRAVNNSITSLYPGQIRNTNDIKKILDYIRKPNTNNGVGTLKNSGNNIFASTAYNTRSSLPLNKTANNNFKSNDNSVKNNTDVNSRYQAEPVRSFTPVSYSSNSNVGVGPAANTNTGSGMSAPAPVSRVR